MSWRLSRERYPLMRVALCAELGDFEVATTGGFWVAAGEFRRYRSEFGHIGSTRPQITL